MSKVLTGAKAVIKLDNFPLVLVSSLTINHENRLEEIPQLDDLLVAEHAENGHRCSFSVNVFKVNRQAAKDLGLSGSTNAADFGFDPLDIRELFLQPELICEVFDSSNTKRPEVIYIMKGVKFSGGTGTVDARGVWTGTWNFVARQGRGI